MKYQYQVLKRECGYQGFFRMDLLQLRHELYAGGWTGTVVRELMEREPVVVVLPYDPKLDRVVLLEQFRVGALGSFDPPWLTEVVAGIIEDGETAEQVAERELWEEAGCRLLGLHRLYGYLSSPGGSSEHVTLYCGLVDSEGVGGLHGLEGESEDIRAYALSREEAWSAVSEGRICSAAPIIALQWLQMNHRELRARWCEDQS